MSRQSNQSNGSASISTYLEHILNKVQHHELICDKGDKSRDKPIEFVQPEDLEGKIGSLTIGRESISDEKLDAIVESVIRYSVKTCSPRFHNQLYHGADEYGLAGSWLSDALNTNNHTFEVAPVFIVVERAILSYIMSKFGWQEGEGDGIMCPGGSIANMYGMVLARHRRFPEAKSGGVAAIGKPLVAFTSEESHYSIAKGANWLGLGLDNVVKVKTDERGRMVPSELDSSIQLCKKEGKEPFFVNATSGSTVMGAFDQLDELAAVCKKHALWLHVDACWGGSFIMSSLHKKHLEGCELVDSIAWNPHKMMGAPLQTSVFITRHNRILHEANSASASYLFQQDKFYDVSYDTGDKSVQCGRKTDAFKLWFMLKARGEEHFEKAIDNAIAQAEYLDSLIQNTPGFRPAFPSMKVPNCTNVCFHYIPPRMRGKPEDANWWEELTTIPPKVKEAMIRSGSLMIGYQPLPHKGLGNFFRMVVHGVPHPSSADMKFIIEEIDRIGKDL